MPKYKNKERDNALIEKALANTNNALSSWRDEMRVSMAEVLRLERSGWQPKPDRAEVLVHELWIMDSGPSQSVWLEVIRRHFDELRAEWEAERPAGMVTQANYEAAVKGRQDFRNAYRKLLPVLRAAEALSVKWRTKGQKVDSSDFFDAINAVDVAVTGGGATPIPFADLPDAERPAVVVPREAKLWADSVGYCSATRYEERTTAKWIKSLDGAKGPAVVVPEDDWSKGKEDCDGNELITFRKDDLVKHMTNRFLGWKLPEDFHPDDGISFEPFFNVEWNAKQGKPPQRRTPTGTNLFNYTQAEAMVRYMIDGAKGGE